MAESSDQAAEKAGKKASEKARDKAGAKCPICQKPVVPKYRPFCSQRCQQIDLGRWLGENYRIAAHQAPQGPAGDGDED